MAEACTHPNCERHGKSPVVGIGCGGEESFPAASRPLTASGGLPGVPVTPQGPEEAPGGAEGVAVYRPLEGREQARHTEALARALEESWLAGEQLDMDRPVGNRIDWLKWAHGIELRLAGLNDWKPGPAETFAQVTVLTPVDTDRVERGARAMFAVTNRADDWDEPSIPADLKDHYRRLARAVLEAR
jgi:hypothetical protein